MNKVQTTRIQFPVSQLKGEMTKGPKHSLLALLALASPLPHLLAQCLFSHGYFSDVISFCLKIFISPLPYCSLTLSLLCDTDNSERHQIGNQVGSRLHNSHLSLGSQVCSWGEAKSIRPSIFRIRIIFAHYFAHDYFLQIWPNVSLSHCKYKTAGKEKSAPE